MENLDNKTLKNLIFKLVRNGELNEEEKDLIDKIVEEKLGID